MHRVFQGYLDDLDTAGNSNQLRDVYEIALNRQMRRSIAGVRIE